MARWSEAPRRREVPLRHLVQRSRDEHWAAPAVLPRRPRGAARTARAKFVTQFPPCDEFLGLGRIGPPARPAPQWTSLAGRASARNGATPAPRLPATSGTETAGAGRSPAARREPWVRRPPRPHRAPRNVGGAGGRARSPDGTRHGRGWPGAFSATSAARETNGPGPGRGAERLRPSGRPEARRTRWSRDMTRRSRDRTRHPPLPRKTMSCQAFRGCPSVSSATCLTIVYSSKPYWLMSLPVPDCLKPP